MQMTRLPERRSDPPPSWSIDRDELKPCAIIVDRSHSFLPSGPEDFELPLQFEFGTSIGSEAFSIAPAGVISTPLEPQRVRTIGCMFVQSKEIVPARAEKVAQNSLGGLMQLVVESTSTMPTAAQPAGGATRIRPPHDLIKLEDRLRLLLQPPLESLLTASDLRFACTPFSFQLDGVAFLYPRHRAVLADEMGLGKTMQAITAIRLLVHQGQLRRVLLVCPKPLVTNWQREFAQWAPELTVGSIEGGPTRRQWLWRANGDVVTLANYETVVRDRDEVCHPDNQYDLVVLDESQRIKNSASTTNEIVRSIPRAQLGDYGNAD